MSGTSFTDPAHCFDMADGDFLLALWIALEARRLARFVERVSEALEEWEPTASVESEALG